MARKLITDKGKTELLRLGFKSEEADGAFTYMALGKGSSAGAQGSTFDEAGGANYSRVKTELEECRDKYIKISATFDETNYTPTDNSGLIKEIALCNSKEKTDNTVFFMYSEVPEIYKTGDISLQYTVIISID